MRARGRWQGRSQTGAQPGQLSHRSSCLPPEVLCSRGARAMAMPTAVKWFSQERRIGREWVGCTLCARAQRRVQIQSQIQPQKVVLANFTNTAATKQLVAAKQPVAATAQSIVPAAQWVRGHDEGSSCRQIFRWRRSRSRSNLSAAAAAPRRLLLC